MLKISHKLFHLHCPSLTGFEHATILQGRLAHVSGFTTGHLVPLGIYSVGTCLSHPIKLLQISTNWHQGGIMFGRPSLNKWLGWCRHGLLLALPFLTGANFYRGGFGPSGLAETSWTTTIKGVTHRNPLWELP